MAKKRSRQRANSRDTPNATGGGAFLCSPDAWRVLCTDGYKPLTECPEVQMCVGVYADLIASMTMHLMCNTDRGDIRIKNELSRKMDINPSRDMTHQSFFYLIVWELMLHGNQVTVPRYKGEYLEDMQPIGSGHVSFSPDGDSYRINVDGRAYSPDEVFSPRTRG